MAAVNPNLPRWVRASLADYLKTAAAALSLPNAVDGLDDRPDSFMEEPARAEISIFGPSIREVSRGAYQVRVDVNVVVSSIQGLRKNAYDHTDLVGGIASALDATIAVKDHGTTDPAETQFCLTLFATGIAEPTIRVQNIQLDTSDRRLHTVLDAKYIGHFHP